METTWGPFLLVSSLAGLWLLHDSRESWFGFRAGPQREAPRWWASEVLFCFLILFLVIYILSVLLDPLRDAESFALFQAAVQLGYVGTGCIFVFWTVRRVHGQSLRALGLQALSLRNAWVVVLFYVFSYFPLAAVTQLWTWGLENVAGLEHSRQEAVRLFEDSVRSGDLESTLLGLFSGLVVAPIGEEILFRGFLFSLARARLGFWGGLVVSSAVFALLHPPLFSMLPIFLVGAFLCYVYERTGSLYAAILYHVLFNGVTFVALLTGVASDA